MKQDAEIQINVMEEIKWEPRLDVAEIGIAVKNGIVSLSGQVDSYAKKIAVENAAKRIKEVRGIVEDLEVMLPNHLRRTDQDIAEIALRSLKWSTSIPDNKVRAIVDDGWIILEGEVSWEYQREEAERAIEHNKGVVGITNLIVIKPRVNVPVIKNAIKLALERSADIEARSITISVDGDKVILEGDVRSLRELYEVSRVVWSAPGVKSVENNLNVK